MSRTVENTVTNENNKQGTHVYTLVYEYKQRIIKYVFSFLVFFAPVSSREKLFLKPISHKSYTFENYK